MSRTSDLAFPDPRAARLFESVMIGNLALPNRLVMAPMGRLGSTVGVLGAPYSDYYGRLIMVAAPKAASA